MGEAFSATRKCLTLRMSHLIHRVGEAFSIVSGEAFSIVSKKLSRLIRLDPHHLFVACSAASGAHPIAARLEIVLSARSRDSPIGPLWYALFAARLEIVL